VPESAASHLVNIVLMYPHTANNSVTNTVASLTAQLVTTLQQYVTAINFEYSRRVPTCTQVALSSHQYDEIRSNYWRTHRSSQNLGYLYSNGRDMRQGEQLGYNSTVLRMRGKSPSRTELIVLALFL
jgi:hypothetical protein